MLALEQHPLEADRPVPLPLRFNAAESADATARNNSVAGDQRRQRIARHCRRGRSRRAVPACARGQLPVGACRAGRNPSRGKPTRGRELARLREERCQRAHVDMTVSSPAHQQGDPNPKQPCILVALRPRGLSPCGRTPLDSKRAVMRNKVKDGTAHRHDEGLHL